jgi:lycopene cyclase domain-containing protein
MSLYSILLLCSILVPLALSFDKKLQFYKQWKYLMPSIVVVALFYIAFDIYFTKLGVWGFNPRYHSSIVFLKLPIEEWLFFIIIPYASIFLHDSIVFYFSKIRLSNKFATYLSIGLLLLSITIVLLNLEKAYTAYIFSLLALVLLFSFFDKTNITSSFYCTFLVILVPFIAVNAILTGSFIDEPVVWYNNNENLGIRFLTIPVEDFGYAFSLVLFNLLLRNKLINLSYGFKQA